MSRLNASSSLLHERMEQYGAGPGGRTHPLGEGMVILPGAAPFRARNS